MTICSSTGRRRELGAELRGIREDEGHNGQDMANLMQWSASTLSRAETGKRPLSEREVATYTGLCRVTGERQQRIFNLLAESDDYRLKAHPGQIPDELHSLIFLESTAIAVDSLQPLYIPGILQTHEYAHALLVEAGMADPAKIPALVETRIGRRQVLTRINPAICRMFIHENALRSPVGGPLVMQRQLLHLLFVGGRPQCSIRVVPISAAGRGLAASAFQVFGYTEDSPLVYVQNETTSEFLENSRDVGAYRNVLSRVATVALSDAQSRDFITWLASDYELQGAVRPEDHNGSEALA